MFIFGMLLVIVGCVLGTMVFCLRSPSDEREGVEALYLLAIALVLWGGYVLYPVST